MSPLYMDCHICAEYLHCSLEEFWALSRDEQTIWRLWVPERARREAAMIERSRREAEQQRAGR